MRPQVYSRGIMVNVFYLTLPTRCLLSRNSKLSLRLRPYDVLVTSPTGGVIETVPNAQSIDGIKKKHVVSYKEIVLGVLFCWDPVLHFKFSHFYYTL